MKKLPLLIFSLFILFATSCKKENVDVQLDEITGYVQKGPFINGTSITLSELSNTLTQSGKTFSSQISDNKGTFSLENLELNSNYIELKANGFYFNEVTNQNSSAQLTLYALSDISDKSDLNVNVLSSLEKGRVEYLVSQGNEFTAAKEQAQTEILSIFEINQDNVPVSELMDISKTGDDNAILLAISVILQGYLPVSDLSELMANISTDIREDGTLDSPALCTTLINNARLIKLNEIRANLEARYSSMGQNVTIPDFEKYVNQFIQNTDFEFTASIKYPATGEYGVNILDKEKTEYNSGGYSMIAELPSGSKLRVKISGNRNWYFPAFQEDTGWKFSDWDNNDYSRIFTSTQTGQINYNIYFRRDSNFSEIVNLYIYENEDVEPTWEKQITIVE